MSCCKTTNDVTDYRVTGLEKEKSRPFDKKFRGPVHERSCTDIICLIVFLVFILGLIFISFWAFYFGDMNKLIHPTNSKGEICGVTPSVKNTSKLVFFNLLVCINMGPGLMAFGCPTKQICVSKCPVTFWSSQIDTGRKNMVCEGDKSGDDVAFQSMSVQSLVNNRICAELVFPSTPVADRCVPNFSKLSQFFNKNVSKDIRNQSLALLNQIKKNDKYMDITEVMSKLFFDFIQWYKYILILFAITLVVSLTYLIFLRFFAAIIVWVTLIMFVLIFIAGIVICFLTYYLIKEKHIADKYFSWYTLSRLLTDKFWLGMGIALSILLFFLVLMLIFLRDRIQIAIAILICTSKSLSYLMELLLWPIILFLMQVSVMCGCTILALQLSTIRYAEGVSVDINNISYQSESDFKQNIRVLLEKIPCIPGDNSTAQQFCTFIKYGSKTYTYLFSFYVLFMFFWLTNFVKALGQMTVAGSFASYYFAFEKPKDIPTFPVVNSFWRAVRYHIGSLAFGSLTVTIVQIIRYILEYIEQRAKNSRNIFAEFLTKCLKCCFWCLEKFIKYINRNCYIMIAIYGQNYCSAARNAFNLLTRNILRVFFVDNVTDYVLLLGKLVIVGGFGVFSFVFFNGIILKQLAPNLFYNYVPVIVTIIGTYIISSMFLQIYEFGTETIFLCFCEDLERNDGSEEKPYFMDKELMTILKKKNRVTVYMDTNDGNIEMKASILNEANDVNDANDGNIEMKASILNEANDINDANDGNIEMKAKIVNEANDANASNDTNDGNIEMKASILNEANDINDANDGNIEMKAKIVNEANDANASNDTNDGLDVNLLSNNENETKT